MVKVKIIFISCAIAFSSFALAGENNVCALVPSNSTSVMVTNGGYALQNRPATGYLPHTPIPQKRPMKWVNLPTSKTEMLRLMAEQEILNRERKAIDISAQINEHYTGFGDNWSWRRYIAVNIGLDAIGWYKEDTIQALAEIDSFLDMEWNVPLINSIRLKSSRLDRLISALIREKVLKYNLYNPHMFGKPNIFGSDVDDFFDEKTLFPGLPTFFQKYVQCYVEHKYRDFFGLKDSEPIVFHVLNTAFENSNLISDCNPKELLALHQSLVFKKYEQDTNNAFTAYINKDENS